MNRYTAPETRGEPPSLWRTPAVVFGLLALFMLVVFGVVLLTFARDNDPSLRGAGIGIQATAWPTTTSAVPTAAQGQSPSPAITVVLAGGIAPTAQTAAVSNPTATGPLAVAVAPDALLALLPTTAELPTLAELPDGFVVTREGPLTAEELAALHPDPATQLVRLQQWGFVQAVRREFEPANNAAGVGTLTYFAAAVVEFGSPEQAREAIQTAHAEALVAGSTQMSDVPAPQIGDLTLASDGTVQITNITYAASYVFIQDGPRAWTFVGLATSDSPLQLVTDVAVTTLGS